jgi:uncharacterized Rmd1/YagE family protein
MKFFNARRTSYHTNPRLIDEAIYTPYVYDPPATNQEGVRQSRSKLQSQTGDLLGIPELHAEDSEAEHIAKRGAKKKSKFNDTPTEAEIFMFDYGTVVIWGMTEAQEKRFLSSM